LPGRQGRHQRLALAGLHFGNIALVQENPAHELHIEGAQPQRPARRLAAIGKRLGQERVKALAPGDTLAEFLGLRDQPGIAQRLVFRFERVYLRHQRARRLDLAIIRGAENLARDRSNTKHVSSVPVFRLSRWQLLAPPARAP
jgi:hypothetical protein